MHTGQSGTVYALCFDLVGGVHTVVFCYWIALDTLIYHILFACFLGVLCTVYIFSRCTPRLVRYITMFKYSL